MPLCFQRHARVLSRFCLIQKSNPALQQAVCPHCLTRRELTLLTNLPVKGRPQVEVYVCFLSCVWEPVTFCISSGRWVPFKLGAVGD